VTLTLPRQRHAPGRIREASRGGRIVRWAGGLGAVIPLLALAFVLATLIIEALGAIRLNGLHFFTGTEWNPGIRSARTTGRCP
jgi:phosphate transport system permease protein